jgi:hypothetical protein
MSGLNRRYDGEYESGDKRGRTGELFRLVDVGDILNGNRVRGFGFANDFLSNGDISDWTLTQATSGTAVNGDARGGVVDIDAGATTDGQGVNLQYGAGESFLPAANKTICVEMNVKNSLVSGDFFFGLSEEDSTLITTGGGNTSANHVGFESVSGNGVILFHGEKATARGTATETIHTFAAATEVLLGFRINGLTNIEVYVNRVMVSDTILTANIPIVEMTPSIVVQADGTRPVVSFDWFDCFQQDKGD